VSRYREDERAVDRARAGASPRPSALELQPSPRCQLSCSYCHAMAPPRPETVYGTTSHDLLRLGEYRTLLAEFIDHGGEDVVVSGGGEPLLHPDADALLDHITRSVHSSHLYTNGLHPLLRAENTDWVERMTTIRVSFHTGLTTRQLDQVRTCLHALGQRRRTSDTTTTVAVLIDTLAPSELAALASTGALAGIDGVEIRSTLAGPDIEPATIASWQALIGDLGAHVADIRVGPVTVPTDCFATYRSVVVDPFGGYRVCCMRAHLPQTDPGHLGNTRDTTFSQALEDSLDALPRLGGPACRDCSARDSSFSQQITVRQRR
jgi:hypothetical protein